MVLYNASSSCTEVAPHSRRVPLWSTIRNTRRKQQSIRWMENMKSVLERGQLLCERQQNHQDRRSAQHLIRLNAKAPVSLVGGASQMCVAYSQSVIITPPPKGAGIAKNATDTHTLFHDKKSVYTLLQSKLCVGAKREFVLRN